MAGDQQNATVLLQDQQSGAPRWLCFRRPVEIIRADTPDEVMQCLERLEKCTESGLCAAGYLGYEAASGLDEALVTHPPSGIPCLWFGIFEDYKETGPPDAGDAGGRCFSLGEWKPSISWQQYNQAIDKIKNHIREGDTYQVNYTFRLRTGFEGDALQFFACLCRAQQSSYAAYIDMGRHVICSVSPEIFIAVNGNTIMSRPMKGTVSRGLTAVDDRVSAEWLRASNKNRAENVMIVDMIRNDIGRIAESGTVDVTRLFEIERYPTVHQMTSTVTAKTSAPVTEIMKTMFPCASITGAPKVKTMEIIKSLEPDPRGIYTGAIGYVAPDRTLQFNVAIRTVVLDMQSGSAEYGVGGGITWDSETRSEYAECSTKAVVLTRPYPEFSLLESLLWDPDDGCYLLGGHLDRLSESGGYFGFDVPLADIRHRLLALKSELPAVRHKIRLLVSREGRVTLESALLNSMLGSRVALSTVPIETETPFVYHKTSNRAAYSDVRSANGTDDDLILWNKDGFITETTIANVVIEDDCGRLLTPPVACGLLAGVKRAFLVERGVIIEHRITREDLRNARSVYIINSVRGWMRLSRESGDTWRVVDEQHYEAGPPGREVPAGAGSRGNGLVGLEN